MLTLSLHSQTIMFGQIMLSLLLGGLLGYERERADKSAGIRTFALVSAGSCLFGILSLCIPPFLFSGVATANIDITHTPSRIAAQVVSGIGFLGAGVMFHEGATVRGLTTAASLWASAAIGVAVAYSLYFIAVASTFIFFGMLLLYKSPMWVAVSPKRKRDSKHSEAE